MYFSQGDENERDYSIISPLLTEKGKGVISKLLNHPHAPKWNHVAGDKLQKEDLELAKKFRSSLKYKKNWRHGELPTWITSFVASRADTVPWFRKVIPSIAHIKQSWWAIPTCSRENIATSCEELVAVDLDLTRLICYRTSGTTGHAIIVPHHPCAASLYLVLLEEALRFYGISIDFKDDRAGCVLLGAQASTVTYATVLSLWGECGFAKINLSSREWSSRESPKKFLEATNPLLLTADPISCGELLRIDPEITPLAIVSTAVAMNPLLKERVSSRYNCPVIEWYSLTETGPIGYYCRCGHGYHVLSSDIYVEVLDEDGFAATPGEKGEIVVSGGRNPYIPLLRYRTGDWGTLNFDPCECGDPMPLIVELEGRKPVVFKTRAGKIVNPVDISRVLREFPLLQHEFSQEKDFSFNLIIREIPGRTCSVNKLKGEIERLFDDPIELKIINDEHLGQRAPKIAYSSSLLLED